MNMRYALLMLAACWAGCAEDRAGEPAPNLALEVPASALTVQEQSARGSAGQGIDAQPRDVQKRYYQALLMTKKQSASTMQQVVTAIGAQDKNVAAAAARPTDAANVSKQRSEAQAQLDKNNQSVRELEAKLATF
jgi:hypothetical protein